MSLRTSIRQPAAGSHLMAHEQIRWRLGPRIDCSFLMKLFANISGKCGLQFFFDVVTANVFAVRSHSPPSSISSTSMSSASPPP